MTTFVYNFSVMYLSIYLLFYCYSISLSLSRTCALTNNSNSEFLKFNYMYFNIEISLKKLAYKINLHTCLSLDYVWRCKAQTAPKENLLLPVSEKVIKKSINMLIWKMIHIHPIKLPNLQGIFKLKTFKDDLSLVDPSWSAEVKLIHVDAIGWTLYGFYSWIKENIALYYIHCIQVILIL